MFRRQCKIVLNMLSFPWHQINVSQEAVKTCLRSPFAFEHLVFHSVNGLASDILLGMTFYLKCSHFLKKSLRNLGCPLKKMRNINSF